MNLFNSNRSFAHNLFMGYGLLDKLKAVNVSLQREFAKPIQDTDYIASLLNLKRELLEYLPTA